MQPWGPSTMKLGSRTILVSSAGTNSEPERKYNEHSKRPHDSNGEQEHLYLAPKSQPSSSRTSHGVMISNAHVHYSGARV